jgi:hypothetical protein
MAKKESKKEHMMPNGKMMKGKMKKVETKWGSMSKKC